jgi:ubiquinone/menaquinone biosynthesis C-methylase UbiE
MKKKIFINDYDKIYYKKNYQKDVNLVFKKSKNLKNKKILDIGCDTGKYTILLKKKFLLSKKNILGIDIDEDSIKLAKKRRGILNILKFKN